MKGREMSDVILVEHISRNEVQTLSIQEIRVARLFMVL
jgi:hypothetical protein